MKRLLATILLFVSFDTYSQTLEQDRLALIALYNAADGENWYFSTRPADYPVWQVPGQPGDNPCGWYGVTCEGNRVTGIALHGEDVSGTIPKEIGNLTALKSLELPGGGFWQETRPTLYGTLPPEFANLINLETLDLTNNFFDEANSQVLFGLPKLKSFSFSAAWQIPAAIGNLANLEKLTIDNRGTKGEVANTGTFPAEIGNLTKLTSLSIYSTNFKSTIPDQIGNLTSLTSLTMVAPTTMGIIPSTIGNLNSLQSLSLSNLTGVGTIPATIGNLTNLTSLTLADLIGVQSIPPEIGSMINLTSLSITGLGNVGPIPSEIGNLTNLENLSLENNGHTGTIPASFNRLTKAFRIYLSGNQLTSPIPTLGALRTRRIYISRNNFTFQGLETSENRFAGYAYQKKIPVNGRNGILSVNAGGTLSKNTYRWYNFGNLVDTKVGDSTFTPTETGNYHVEVTNSVAIGLTLISETVERALPVTLISFHGKAENASNVVTWKTSSETNNKGFEIEKSADAKTFEKIGFVDGNGDTKDVETYHFTDKNPFRISYYRLKQFDHNGAFEHSNVVVVKNEPDLNVYPNPAQSFLTVSGFDNETDLALTNQLGEIVLKRKVKALKPVDVRSLPNGIYILNVGGTVKRVAISR